MARARALLAKPHTPPVASAGTEQPAGTRRPSADSRSRRAAIVRSAPAGAPAPGPAGTGGGRARPARASQGRGHPAVMRPPGWLPRRPAPSPRSEGPRRRASRAAKAGGGTGPDRQAGLEGSGDWRTQAPRRRLSGEAWAPSPSSPSSPFLPSALLPSPRPQIHLHVSGSHTCVPSTYCPGTTFVTTNQPILVSYYLLNITIYSDFISFLRHLFSRIPPRVPHWHIVITTP